MNRAEKKHKKLRRTLMMAFAICLMSGSILAYADYQFGVDWHGPYTTSVSGAYCDHDVTFWLMDYLNDSQRIKASTVHSKYSTENYTNLRYTYFSVVQGETGRCKAKDGYHSYPELDESPNGGGYFGTRRIFCGTEGY
jgi:alpha-D-ribose 1-methylphosphonate 5-triphosphate synthase subunit PhnH